MLYELEQIKNMIKARYPIIYVVSWEEKRVINNLRAEFGSKRIMYVWSAIRGFLRLSDSTSVESSADPLQALNYIIENRENALFILNDFHMFLIEQNIHLLRLLREVSQELKESLKTIIILSPVLRIPPELEKEISVIDFPLPNQEEIENQLDNVKIRLKHKKNLNLALDNEEKEQLIKALMGLTYNEIENVLSKSIGTKKATLIDKLRFCVENKIPDYLKEIFSKEDIKKIASEFGINYKRSQKDYELLNLEIYKHLGFDIDRMDYLELDW